MSTGLERFQRKLGAYAEWAAERAVRAPILTRLKRYAKSKLLPAVEQAVETSAARVDPELSTAPMANGGPPHVPDPEQLPMPPENLWIYEGNYLESGQVHVSTMREALGRHGLDLADAGGILDFGCGAGRLMRWLTEEARSQEVWGVDIDIAAIRWAQRNLSPPLRFSTCTTAPHLPFGDQTFGLVFAGSVFTHIADLADPWLLELRRVTRDGGLLYLTVHDQATVNRFLENAPDHPWTRDQVATMLNVIAEHRELFSRLGTDYSTIVDHVNESVYYHIDHLRRLWGQWLDILEVVEGAYFTQSAVVLRR